MSISHYLRHRGKPISFSKTGPMSRNVDIVKYRILLGYRSLWQVVADPTKKGNQPCKLCSSPWSHSLQHYIKDCPKIDDLRPKDHKNLTFHELCDYFLQYEDMDSLLKLYPEFASG